MATREDCLQQCQNRYHSEGITAAVIAARKLISIPEAEDMWPGSVSSETGDS